MTQDAAEHLQALGFTDYEARAYIALLQAGPLTGYQLARASGIPRPNVYPVIDRLERRGAIARVEGRDAPKYAALPWEDMLGGLSADVEGHLAGARDALQRLEVEPSATYAWNLQGYESILARAEALVGSAQRRVAVGLWSTEARRLAPALAGAAGRGVEFTTLCLEGCPEECGGCRGDVFRYSLAGPGADRWLVVVIDDEQLLLAHILSSGGASGVVTRQESLVAIAAQYLRNTIAAAEIVRSLGGRLMELLDDRARAALEGGSLASPGGAWAEQFVAAVSRASR
jgi:hypothetical protein